MSDDGMIDEFKVEAAELFENAENSLLNIDKGEDFLSNYNNIFRAFHSLKGAAGMFGLLPLQEHMHKLESLFEAQKKIATMNNKQIDYFLTGIDIAKKLLDGEDANFYHIEIANFNEVEQDSTPVTLPTPTKSKIKLNRKKGVIFIISKSIEFNSQIKAILENNEFTAFDFTTSSEALVDIESYIPNVIVCNLENIEEVKSESPDSVIVLLSDKLSEDKIKEAILLGAHSVLSMPFEEVTVLNICGNAISKNMTMQLLEKAVSYILYQFTDLDVFLKSQGKEGIRTALKKDLQTILELRKSISNFSSIEE